MCLTIAVHIILYGHEKNRIKMLGITHSCLNYLDIKKHIFSFEFKKIYFT